MRNQNRTSEITFKTTGGSETSIICNPVIPRATIKTGRQVRLPVDWYLIGELRASLRDELGIETSYLFSEANHPVDYNVANRAMKKLCRKAGLPEHRMYVFRKTWITAMVDRSGLTLAQIAYLAGNTPAVIMKSYYGRRDAPPDAAIISAALRGCRDDKK